MWRNPSNNYEEYFRDHQPGVQSRYQILMDTFNRFTPRTNQDHSVHTWTDIESFTNYAFEQSSPHSQHQEDEEPEDPETIDMLLRVLEDRKKRREETSEYLNRPILFDAREVLREIEELSKDEDKDVQDAQIPLKEEIEEIPKDADTTQEGEVVEVFFPYCEIVVEQQDDHINTQQQSPAGDEVEEFIRLHEIAPHEDALALIVAVMNEETLRLNKASTKYAIYKEEEEMVQIFELSQKELHQDEAAELRVPGTPTPRIKYPQGPRKRLEWKIKHKWRIKPRNV